MKDESITKILYYKVGRSDEMWFFSTINKIDGDDIFEYHILTLIDNVPEIEDVESPLEMLKSINIKPRVIDDNSLDYIRFIAIKDIAEKNLLSKMKKEEKSI